MIWFSRTMLALLCSAAPQVLAAQSVELRSADEFISLNGEITGFDGALVTIMTRVGPISIPAAEVICYGAGCDQLLQNNSFGLTAASLAGVAGQQADAGQVLADDLTVSFAGADDHAVYRTVAAAYISDNPASVTVQLESTGQISLGAADGGQTALLRMAADGAAADITLGTTALTGRAPQAFAAPADWAAGKPGHQMLALRAFAVVAAPGTGVDAVTLDQLAAIYAGEIVNWSQIGGTDLPVLPLQLPVGSVARDEMIAVLMDPAGKTIADDVLTMADDASMAAATAGLPGSISLIDAANTGNAAVLPVAGACGFPVGPNDFDIAAGDYPLLRPVMARFDKVPATALVTELFDFAATDAAQSALSRDGALDLRPRVQSAADRNKRLTAVLTAELDPAERPVAAEMFQVLFEAERLTVTLIGGATSSAEGAWNRAMMLALADWLARPENTGRAVIFAGFGDSDAGPQAAIDSSALAAKAMAAAFADVAPDLLADGGLSVTSAGFGAVSRTTCYDSQTGGADRTRVEVWIK